MIILSIQYTLLTPAPGGSCDLDRNRPTLQIHHRSSQVWLGNDIAISQLSPFPLILLLFFFLSISDFLSILYIFSLSL